MDLTDCGKEFQAIADLCLNDSFPILEFGLSRVRFKSYSRLRVTRVHLEFNFRSPTHVTNISRDNKVLSSDPARQRAHRQMFLNFVFVFVYTVIRGRAVRTSLDKKLDAVEFLFLSHGETIS